MKAGRRSEPWTCERGMNGMRPNAGFCDKGPSSHEAARSSRISSWISSPRIVCVVFMKCPEQTRRIRPRVRDENPGVPKCHVHVRVSKASNGTSRFVTRENRAIPKIARLRRSFSRERAGESSYRLRFLADRCFAIERGRRRFFQRSARASRVSADATASITTRRREEKRNATSYVLASYVFSRTTRDYPALLGEFPGERQQRLVRARRAHQRDTHRR